MSVRNCTARGPIPPSDHIVQFFDTDESRAEHVAAFLADGYLKGESLVVIARPVNWGAMIERLEKLGVSVREATVTGRLIVKDATETLRRLSRAGSPDAKLFNSIVGEPLEKLAAGGARIRAYGEMVDLLALRGELTDAIALETLWNSVGARVPLSLLCGYSAAHFVSTATHAALLEICGCHSSVSRNAHDPLGDWVLTVAHNSAAGSSLQH